MSSPDVYDTVHDYIVAQWAGRTPLSFENDTFDPPGDPEHWVFVEIFGSFYDQASIGAESVAANVWREGGDILAHVLIPRGDGTRQGRVYARQIADLFRGQEIGGIRFRSMSIGAGEPSDEDGNYWRMTVTIDWERDF